MVRMKKVNQTTNSTSEAVEINPATDAHDTENSPTSEDSADFASMMEPGAARELEALPQSQTPDQQEDSETMEPMPVGEALFPYTAVVSVAIAMVRKTVGPGTADMLKAVGTLKQGTQVTVVNRHDGFAQLANGLWINEAFLTLCPPM